MPKIRNATVYLTTGEIVDITPTKGKIPYEALKSWVNGYIEVVPLGKGKVMIVNETGKLDGLPINPTATAIWKEAYPIAKYPLNNDELIVGNAIVANTGLI